MLLASNARLEEIIIEHLAVRPLQSVEELQRQIARTHREYSVPALYQELRKLREHAVVLKIDSRYALRVGWVLKFLRLADELHQSYLGESQLTQVIPQRGSQQTWRFNSLSALGRFATQTLLVLMNESGAKEMFEWVEQAWFSLTHAEEEEQFLESIQSANVKHYMVIGDDKPLNSRYTMQAAAQGVIVSSAYSPFHELDVNYYSLVGDFIGTMKIADDVLADIEQLFSEQSSGSPEEVARAMSLLQRQTKTSFTVEHRPKKAARLRRMFAEYFGV